MGGFSGWRYRGVKRGKKKDQEKGKGGGVIRGS